METGVCGLIGLRRFLPDLLAGSASPADVALSRIEAQAQSAGLSYALLPRGYGVKTTDDLRRLRRDLQRGVVCAPQTAKVLNRLGL
jgi:glycosyltransferase A (GT-A) superfamily protein (DUF2064 family)